MKKQGVLLEKKGNQGIILTEDGDFVSGRLEHGRCAVGEVVRLDPLPNHASARKVVWMAAAVLFLALVLPMWQGWPAGSEPVLAYVSVDINPSLELGVGSSGRVWDAVALNRDAERLLELVPYLGRTLPEVLDDITGVSLEYGYLAGGSEASPDQGMILIAAVPAQSGADLPDRVGEALRQGEILIRERLDQKNVTASVQVIKKNEYVLKQDADQVRLSIGRYLLLLESELMLGDAEQGGDLQFEEQVLNESPRAGEVPPEDGPAHEESSGLPVEEVDVVSAEGGTAERLEPKVLIGGDPGALEVGLKQPTGGKADNVRQPPDVAKEEDRSRDDKRDGDGTGRDGWDERSDDRDVKNGQGSDRDSRDGRDDRNDRNDRNDVKKTRKPDDSRRKELNLDKLRNSKIDELVKRSESRLEQILEKLRGELDLKEKSKKLMEKLKKEGHLDHR